MGTPLIGGRTTWVRRLAVVPLLAGVVALGAPSPVAAAYSCTGTVNGGTIKDSVVVPAEAICTLTGVVVRGGLTVESGARVQVEDSEIRGGVSGNNPEFGSFARTVVRGSVSITGVGLNAGLVIQDSEIRGNLSVTDGDGIGIGISNNSVRGTLTVSNNTMQFLITISGNSIDVDLVCDDNYPLPGGEPNTTVGGTKSGQCAGL